MKGKQALNLDRNQLLQGSIASLNNTLSLLRDAEILIENGSYIHALFFIFTAVEEYFKRYILYGFGMKQDIYEQKEINSVIDGLKYHNFKAIGGQIMASVGTGKIWDFLEEIDSQEKMREKITSWKYGRETALYTNWDKESQLWLNPVFYNDDPEMKDIVSRHLKNISGFVHAYEREINKDKEYAELVKQYNL